eukprot:196544_1
MAANSDMVTPLGLFFSPHKIAIEFSSTPFEEHGAIDRSDEIYEIRVRNVWIGHGFWAGLGSIFTGPLAGSSITHWWVEIETKNGHWYCAQWESMKAPKDIEPKGSIDYDDVYYDEDDAPYLCLSRQSSLSDVTWRGKWEACCQNKSKSVTTRYKHKCDKNSSRTIGDLMAMMKQQGHYHLVNNNCRHFGTRMNQWISI